MRSIYLTFLILATCISCNTKTDTAEQWSQDGNLYLATATPEPGQDLKLRYEPSDIAAEKTSPQAVYYIIVDNKVYASDINLNKKDSVYTETIKIPDTATAIAFSFKNGDKLDDNETHGYVFELYEDGKELAGSTLSALNFKAGLGSYLAGIKFEPDTAAVQLKKAFAENPENKKKLIPEYFSFINRADKAMAEDLSSEYLAQYNEKSNLSEKEYKNLSDFYSSNRNKTAYDSIRKLAMETYANGTMANEDKYSKLTQLKDVEEKEQQLAEINDTAASKSSSRKYLEQQIALGYLEKGNTEKFKEYASKIKNKAMLASMYNNASWEMAQKDKNLELAADISKQSLDLTKDLKNSKEAKPDYWSMSEYTTNLDNNIRQYSDTYAYILHKQGKNDEAIIHQKEAVSKGESPEMNERYVEYLMEAKDYDQVVTIAEEYIKNNTASAKTTELYKEAYQESGKDMSAFDGQLASLEKTAKEKAMTDLRSKMIDEEAPQFSLKNMKGEEVALAELKGKTVVVDFWATWCGPCKASFPGMQKAVEAYEDDPKVAFLFLNTWESTADEKRMQEVQDFIAKNKYSFNVLMDNRTEEGSTEYNVVSDFGVDGIPTKFVIGPDGRIKFKEVGYDGNNDALVKKLGMMIDLASS